jgi:hypothetical protein
LSSNQRDRFDVDKIYHTKEDGQEWSMDHNSIEDLADDERVQNWGKKMKDGRYRGNDEGLECLRNQTWQITGGENRRSRLEVWSPRRGNEEETRRVRWLNVEITVYCRVEAKHGDPPYAWQLYCRGGHHSSNDNHQCEGSALKARWYNRERGNNGNNGNENSVVKEICHPAYSSNTAVERNRDVEDHGNGDWYGAKLIVYNIKRDNRTLTKMEVWTDPGDRTNNWKIITEYVDDGDWHVDDEFEVDDRKVRFDEWCGRCGKRRNEILSEPGGKDNRNCIALRTDKETVQFKFFSCREIDPNGRIRG